MADEVSAWEDYNRTAQAARPLPNRRQSNIRNRRSSEFRMSTTEAENLLQFSKYFDDNEVLLEEKEQENITAIELPEDIVEILQDIFSVFYEAGHFCANLKKETPNSCRGWISATMPWLTQHIKRETEGNLTLRRALLFFDLSLRGIGQVYFQNSPLAGLFILIGLLIQSPRVAFHGVVGLVISNLTAYVLGFTEGLIESGLFGYNAILVGLALATFAGKWSWYVLIAVSIMSAVSSIVFVVMGKMLVQFQAPPFTLPFNVLTLLLLVSSATSNRWTVEVREPDLPNYTADMRGELSIADFFAGTLRGIGQVFLADSMIASAFILVGIGICSPIAAIASYVGSLIGCLCAWGAGSIDGIVSGLWSYNPSLCATAMFMFYVPSFSSGVLSVLSIALVVVIQQATIAILAPFGLPAMTLPFCVVGLLFIILQGTTTTIIAVPLATLTVPEDHLNRVKMLQNGFRSLKDALVADDESESFKHVNSEHMKSLRLAVAADADQPRDSRRNAVDSTGSTRDAASRVFDQFSGDLRLEEFIGALKGARLTEQAGLQFAASVFGLMDLDKSSTIDREEFIALSLVSRVLLGIHRDLAKFFDAVDADQSGAISFDELDATGVYLGETALTEAERAALAGLDEAKIENNEMDIVELVNFVTVAHVKALVSDYHDRTAVSSSTSPVSNTLTVQRMAV